MVDDKDDKEEKLKKKTLVLSGVSSIDISKDSSLSEKNIRGRYVSVKIKNKKNLEEAPQEQVKKKDQDKSISKLTKEEEDLRLKLAQEYNEIDIQDDVDKKIVNTSFQIVNKGEIPTIDNTVFDIPSEPIAHSNSKNSSFDDDFEAKEKKRLDKKKLLDEENLKRKTSLNSWKNVYVSQVNQEEDDEEDDEDFLEVKSKFISNIKRKNKYNNKNNKKITKNINISGAISVQDLAIKLAEKTHTVLKTLDKMGVKVSLNDIIDEETAILLGEELNHVVTIIHKDSIENEFLVFNDKDEDLKARPPVVAIMGHVDHGKTTLLDTIRKANVVSGESGGITQHIGAYQVVHNGETITFLDTPGHEAFSQIRSRGSKVTDIAIIVVAADDGVKPQTVEAINHAKDANIPIIVAINKIDKPDINVQRVKTELLQQNLVLEELGGDILSVEISAKNNLGIDKLLEAILLQAEMLELKTNHKALAKGSIIEVKVSKGLGFFASVLVERGELKVGDSFVCGVSKGRVKVMIDDKGNRLKSASPSCVVEVSGFEDVVNAGDDFIVVPNEAKLNDLIDYRKSKLIKLEDSSKKVIDVASLLSEDFSDVKHLSLIIKADAQGSLEAILQSIKKLTHDELNIKVIHSGVGEIVESDVMMAKIAKGFLVGFHSRANTKAKELAKKEGVEIRYHSIIYKLIDDVKMMMGGLLDPDIVENIIGYAEVREVFSVSKVGNIAGCFVTEGTLKRSAFVRLLRNNIVIYDGVLSQLKRYKDDAKEVKQSFECGVMLEGYNDIQTGDMVECYEKLEVKKEIN